MNKERHKLTIEINGKPYEGHRIIVWNNLGEMTQIIYYQMKYSRKDLRRYKPGHEKVMESVARMILEDLVIEVGLGK